MNTHTNDTLIRAAQAAAEAFLAALDEPTSTADPATTFQVVTEGSHPAYDPLHDNPPRKVDPKGSELEQLMAHVAYLGAIGRLNADEGRGATSKEISGFARRAGYADGRVVNGWNSRAGSPRAIENIDGERFLNAEGLKWIQADADKLGIDLQGDFATVPRPE